MPELAELKVWVSEIVRPRLSTIVALVKIGSVGNESAYFCGASSLNPDVDGSASPGKVAKVLIRGLLILLGQTKGHAKRYASLASRMLVLSSFLKP